MSQRLPLMLSCLGLFSASAVTPALSAEKSSADAVDVVAEQSDALPHYRLPAVPPMAGPESPLLQLGLIKPVRRPQTRSRHAPNEQQIDIGDELATNLDAQSINPPILFTAHYDGIALPMRITLSDIDLSSNDKPIIEIADNLFTPRASVDLPMTYDVAVTLPAQDETTVAERRVQTVAKQDLTALKIIPVIAEALPLAEEQALVELLSPPKPRQREEKLAAAIRAQSKHAPSQAAQTGAGGPEVEFTLRR